tara:strand:- start:443 stop:856 length:414 start_codon:yes stop_codon:yes gene_type:complete
MFKLTGLESEKLLYRIQVSLNACMIPFRKEGKLLAEIKNDRYVLGLLYSITKRAFDLSTIKKSESSYNYIIWTSLHRILEVDELHISKHIRRLMKEGCSDLALGCSDGHDVYHGVMAMSDKAIKAVQKKIASRHNGL